MKTKRFVIAAFAIAVLLFGLAGCSSASSSEENRKPFVGSWQLVALEDGESELTIDDFNLMRSRGHDGILVLNEDGSASFDLFGVKEAGTWDAKSSTAAVGVFDGADVQLTLSEGELTFSQGNNQSMHFIPVASANVSSANADSADVANTDTPSFDVPSADVADANTPGADADSANASSADAPDAASE